MGLATEVQTETATEAPPAVAEEVEAPSPEVTTEQVVTEGAGEQTTEEPPDPYADLSGEDWEAILARAPKEKLESLEVVKAREQSAEDRGRVRATEERQNRQAQTDGNDELIQTGYQAAAWLEQNMKAVENDLYDLDRWTDENTFDAERSKAAKQAVKAKLDPNLVLGALDAARAGAIAEASRIFTQKDLQHVAKHADLIKAMPFTADEDQEFAKARYEDARTGNRTALDLLMTKLVDRAEQRGIEKGRALGRKDKEAVAKSLEAGAKLTAIKNGTAPNLGVGQPTSNRPLTVEEAQNLPIDELIRRSKAS